MKLLLPMFIPIAFQETTVKRLKKNSGGSNRTGKKVSRIPNPHVKTSDILSDLLMLVTLTDDTVPFDAGLFATSTSMDQ